jgi:branched-subunit amino acid aminotransferase/4-amino-4-deoxychorismate lyase
MTSFLDDLPYNAPAVERGVGFFETVLLLGRRAVLWEEHVLRLLSSLASLHLPVPTRREIEQATERAVLGIPLDSTKEMGLRISWLALRASLEARESWRLDVSIRDIPAASLRRREGSRAVSLPTAFMRDTPGLKSTSYLAAVLGGRYAQQHGGDEGLFVAFDGSYTEGTATALLAWSSGQPVASSHMMLPSITAAAFAKETPQAPLTSALLRGGAILLGSLTKAAPMLSLDGEPCQQPAVMLQRISAFNAQLAERSVLL